MEHVFLWFTWGFGWGDWHGGVVLGCSAAEEDEGPWVRWGDTVRLRCGGRKWVGDQWEEGLGALNFAQ